MRDAHETSADAVVQNRGLVPAVQERYLEISRTPTEGVPTIDAPHLPCRDGGEHA
jgi:hypothetical protein